MGVSARTPAVSVAVAASRQSCGRRVGAVGAGRFFSSSGRRDNTASIRGRQARTFRTCGSRSIRRKRLRHRESRQAGSDLLRYAEENGRVTLPATVSGPFSAPHVGIDTADVTKRALRNAAAGEVQKRMTNDSVKKGLLGLLKR